MNNDLFEIERKITETKKIEKYIFLGFSDKYRERLQKKVDYNFILNLSEYLLIQKAEIWSLIDKEKSYLNAIYLRPTYTTGKVDEKGKAVIGGIIIEFTYRTQRSNFSFDYEVEDTYKNPKMEEKVIDMIANKIKEMVNLNDE